MVQAGTLGILVEVTSICRSGTANNLSTFLDHIYNYLGPHHTLFETVLLYQVDTYRSQFINDLYSSVM